MATINSTQLFVGITHSPIADHRHVAISAAEVAADLTDDLKRALSWLGWHYSETRVPVQIADQVALLERRVPPLAEATTIGERRYRLNDFGYAVQSEIKKIYNTRTGKTATWLQAMQCDLLHHRDRVWSPVHYGHEFRCLRCNLTGIVDHS